MLMYSNKAVTYITIIKLFTEVKISNDFVPYNSNGLVSVCAPQTPCRWVHLQPQHSHLKYHFTPLTTEYLLSMPLEGGWSIYSNITIMHYRTQENFGRGKNWWIWQIVSYSPKFSPPIFTDTLKMYLAYALTVTHSPNFLSNSFYLYCLPKFPLPNFFHVWYIRNIIHMYVYMHCM